MRYLCSSSYLDGEDLDGHLLPDQLSPPHTAKAPPGFDLQQLQWLLTRDGGGGQLTGVLQQEKEEEEGKKKKILIFNSTLFTVGIKQNTQFT